MRRIALITTATLGAALALPAAANAQGPLAELTESVGGLESQVSTLWVIVAAMVVMFMQAGFAFLEIGFSRGKNVGTGVAKIFVNFSVASIAYWAIGFAIAFGGTAWLAGDHHWFFGAGSAAAEDWLPVSAPAFLFFQFVFCAVSLAIVWGTTLERIKFAAYGIFAFFFAAIIYPVISHWVWGSGWLSQIGNGVQDFAGSSVVHLTGATAGLAALILLGARKGKFGPDGKPRAIPGHSMPLVGLGVLILWLGWFGFNGGSALGTDGNFFAQVVLNTNLGAAGGVIGASVVIYLLTRTLDVGMSGNGAIAGLVGVTAPSGFVDPWAALVIGLVAGVIVVFGVLAIEKRLDDPIGALSAHGLAGIWGTLSCGLFTTGALAGVGTDSQVGNAGLFYGGGLEQLGVQALAVAVVFVSVFAMSFIVFALIKATVGLRVTEAEEDAGLDITSHGMYGYPEQFIPREEIVPPIEPTVAGTPLAESVSNTTEATSMAERS